MKKEIDFIFDEKLFTEKQAKKVENIAKALENEEDSIDFCEYSDDTEESLYKWEMINGDVYILDGDTFSYLRVVNLPKKAKYEYSDYGNARNDYLKYEHPSTYKMLKNTNKLEMHLAYIEKICYEAEEKLMSEMQKAEGITAELKARDMLEWVGRNKELRSRVYEIICEDMVYIPYSAERQK